MLPLGITTIIRNNRLTNKLGGICICVKKYIIFKKLDSFIDIPDVLESLNILLFPDSNKPFLISAIYRLPHNSFNNNTWNSLFNKLFSFTNETKASCLLLGDFNCHHSSWDNFSSIDPVGNYLFETINDSNLIILNNGDRTFVGNPNIVSAPDLSIISSDLAATCNWSVLSDSFSSDHLPVIINVNFSYKHSIFFLFHIVQILNILIGYLFVLFLKILEKI